MMMASILRNPALLLRVTCLLVVVQADSSNRRWVELVNESTQHRVDVFWVNSDNGDLFSMRDTTLEPGGTMPLNTFVGHEFELHEMPHKKTGECGDKTCRRAMFTIGPEQEQKVYLQQNMELKFEDSKSKAKAQAGDLIKACQDEAKRKAAAAASSSDALLESLVQCVEHSVASRLEEKAEELSFQETVRKGIAAKLENYTCEDDDLPTSDPKDTEYWTSPRDGVSREVLIMHTRAASRIHVVRNFIDQEECDAMEQSAEPQLHRATVADGSGGSKYSEHRKAMQAGIKVPWNKEEEGDAIARLSRRVYDYTNHVLDLDIHEFGQEDLMSIQYFGRGKNDTAPDRYTPHCDGECAGLKHKHGTRVATMVMYCKIPDSGGHTNFRNAGVHVRPEFGNAIFFSYIDPATLTMDTGFTEHSGCPVFEGGKKIVTQWIRYGVDSENPWDSFNTLGIKKSEANDD